MRPRFALLLPYLMALLVLVAIVWGRQQRSITTAEASGQGELTLTLDHEMPDRGTATKAATEAGGVGSNTHLDLVCQMEVGRNIEAQLGESSYFFCTEQCREIFLESPQRFMTESCLVCRSDGVLTPVAQSRFEMNWQETRYRFCSAEHRDAFAASPLEYFMHSMWGLPAWLYYASIVFVLLISFGIFEWRSLLVWRTRAHRSAHPRAESPVTPQSPRIDLLRHAGVGWALRSRGFRFAARLVFVLSFLGILIAGLFGNQLPSKNIAPLLTWTIWWGGLIWVVAYLGKFWCFVCPWDAIAEWSERLQLWGRRHSGLGLGLKWPRALRNVWPATFFFVALTWIELGFGVTLNPRVTAWLGLAILVMAFMSAFVFERKSFCRYGCLVGRISGLYALFSPIEVRAREAQVCKDCTTNSCYTGNAHGDACPTLIHPGMLRENTYCIMCMECLNTCEQENMTVNLRPWGEDLLHLRKPRSDEAYLALIMLSLTGLHGLTMTAAWGRFVGAIETTLGLGPILGFTLGMLVVMVAPVVIYAALVRISHFLAGQERLDYRAYFLRYAYALLPIALFYHLAHNSEHLLMEGQKVLALLSDPLGREWNLMGTSTWTLEPLVNLPTLWMMQILFVAVGHIFSLWVARKAAGDLFESPKAAFRSQLPMLAAMILFSVVSLWLLKQPMEMRSSGM